MLKTKKLPVLSAFIIDDEMDICFLLSSLLRQKKIFSECAYTLKEAEKALHHKYPEIIFLDNHLPDGEGIDFIRALKKMHPLTKIIMITADDNPTNRDKAMSEGVNFFISKPFSQEMISNIVDTFLA